MSKSSSLLKMNLTYVLLTCCLFSCSDDDFTPPPSEEEEIVLDEHQEDNEEETSENTQETIEGEMGTVTFYNKDLAEDHYILVNDALSNRVYLMDKSANIVYEWPLDERNIGNDVLLLEDGTLLASLQADNPEILFGGFGGKIQIIAKNGEALWDFTYSNSEYRSHHDVELLPNGNILAIAWEKMPEAEALENGSKYGTDLYPESIIEIDPNTNTITWQWHAKDHLIQDYDSSKLNYGVIENNPQLINLNYYEATDGNIMHANGIAYDDTNDLIYLSVNYYSEVWVIDHSTTTEEAAGHTNGNFERGGDLIYRFGNPSTQNKEATDRLFHNNHFPNLYEEGKMLIFSNGGDLEQSTVYEFRLPNELSLQTVPETIDPEITWSYSNPAIYSPKVSGAVRLPNGNTLITEGDHGIWEVTTEGEIVWEFSGVGFFWRAYHYAKDDPAILALDL
ncbi:aryl-sulfate sulfotransferase [Maribacter sp. MMG018]|uniref:aryl-sulfate sulfotransferase n=1 Tax=Maribacter sp. MMG018 TaxID=2822688 RepID=UPI001B36EB21|nr:aryl-sulfate sulfotransferase [Maribacter sp. MMG018]MBQ4914099.1 aryl-sulfate sulfotransferase [Maribacter sp. MMG018]